MEDTQTALAELTDKGQEALAAILKIRDSAAITASDVAESQRSIAATSANIEDAKNHAASVCEQLDAALALVASHATKAASHEAAATEHSEAAKVRADEIAELHEALAETIAEAKKSQVALEASNVAIAALVKRADTADARVMAYEEQLKAFKVAADAQLKAITNLLPAATAAGLAHSFDKRRQSFLEPSKSWQKLFVGAILCLIILAGWGLYNVSSLDHVITYDELFRNWISKLPVVGALIWLALHSSRESALAKRLEEDYGYKSAIAECFQGFQERMKELETSTEPGSALSQLYANTLAIIANPPGRIYEKHSLIATPTDGAIDAAKRVAESTAKAIQGTPVT